MKTLCLHQLEVVNDLRNVAVISLACELENLINVFRILTESTSVLILTFHINFHLESLAIGGGALALGVIDQSLVDKSLEKGFWNMLICHGVSCHLHLVEVFALSDNVGHHALVVHQVDLQIVA